MRGDVKIWDKMEHKKEMMNPGYKKHDSFFDGPAWKRELPSASLFNGVKKNEDPELHENQKLKHEVR